MNRRRFLQGLGATAAGLQLIARHEFVDAPPGNLDLSIGRASAAAFTDWDSTAIIPGDIVSIDSFTLTLPSERYL